MTCTIDGCTKSVFARGWCAMHYGRWRRNGSTDDPRPTDEQRFWAKVDLAGPDDCWLWNASRFRGGHGSFYFNSTLVGAHRFAYELLVGPIPEGLHVDHLCHNADASCFAGNECLHRRCVNPAHLEPVTHQVNIARGRINPQLHQTHCKRGHEFTPENTYVNAGKRTCRQCYRAKKARYRAQRRTRAQQEVAA